MQSNKSVTKIDLGMNAMRDKGAVSLGKMLESNTSLRWLGLKLNKIKNAGLLAIAHAVNTNRQAVLEEIMLAGNDFEDKVLLEAASFFQRANPNVCISIFPPLSFLTDIHIH